MFFIGGGWWEGVNNASATDDLKLKKNKIKWIYFLYQFHVQYDQNDRKIRLKSIEAKSGTPCPKVFCLC